MEQNLLQWAGQLGLAGFLVYLTWRRDVDREVRMSQSLERTECFVRDTLLRAIEKNTSAMEACRHRQERN